MTVAGRDNGMSTKKRRGVALATAAAYRTATREFAAMSILDVWYAHFDVEDALAQLKSELPPKKAVRPAKAQITKARTRDSMQALAKLTTVEDGQRRIISDPPLIVPIKEMASLLDVGAVYRFLRALSIGYTRTLPAHRRWLVQRFTLTAVARKVVGVGSVGTETWILLMEPEDGFESRCFCRPSRHSARCWPTTPARVNTVTRASVSSPVSISCKPPATSSSAGNQSPFRVAVLPTSTTSANCATGNTRPRSNA